MKLGSRIRIALMVVGLIASARSSFAYFNVYDYVTGAFVGTTDPNNNPEYEGDSTTSPDTTNEHSGNNNGSGNEQY